jgi:hypothetical protein
MKSAKIQFSYIVGHIFLYGLIANIAQYFVRIKQFFQHHLETTHFLLIIDRLLSALKRPL